MSAARSRALPCASGEAIDGRLVREDASESTEKMLSCDDSCEMGVREDVLGVNADIGEDISDAAPWLDTDGFAGVPACSLGDTLTLRTLLALLDIGFVKE